MRCGASSVGPSQIRYVCYYDYCLDHVMARRPPVHLLTVEVPVSKREWNDSNKSLRFQVKIVRVPARRTGDP